MVVAKEKKTCCKHAKKKGHKRNLFPISFQHRLAQLRGNLRENSFLPQLFVSRGSLPFENAKPHRKANSKCDNLSVSSVLNSPFPKVCRLLLQLDSENDFDLVREIILHFSLRLYGLPECPSEDLPLAVYLFIEDTFGIQSKFELCVQLQEGGDSNVIGVVFETICMKYKVLKNDELLEGAEVRLKDNKDFEWIADALEVVNRSV